MSALEHFATYAVADSTFFASALSRYQQLHSLTDEQLAAELGCAVADLARVRVCGMPRGDADQFADDCAAIAARYGVKVDVVTRIAWPW